MEATSSKSSSVASSPFSSPNLGALLKIRVISWSQETGLPVTVRVRVRDKIFNLHKHQLFSKSGYFKRAFELEDSNDLELPESFPGGPDTFGTLALFLYGSSTMVDPFNVAALRCAAEFLEMVELSERFDLYLTKVALQCWEDTLIVLQKCRPLLPLAEELLIVGRCIESLAFMACMEILDPDRRQDRHAAAQSDTAQDCSPEATTMTTTKELWIKDLIALPFEFFKRVIRSLRRQGMKERYIAPIIVFYANKWVISKKTKQFWDDDKEEDASLRVSSILRGVLDLLRPSRHVSVGFYFALLSRSLELDSKKDYGGIEAEIEERIVTFLHTTRAEDLLLVPSLATMERIVSRYASSDPEKNSTVAELWDSYVSRIVLDPKIGTERFVELVERIPISFRQSHDRLYTAMSAFLRAHPSITQEERSFACKSLICQRLSQEMCVQAVQNESMPLRLIVQALFAQQLNTHRAFKDCSDSFRRPMDNDDQFSKEYDSTSFRIQSLEQELESLKKSLQKREEPNGLKNNRSTSKKSKPKPKPKPKPLGHVTTNCIGSVSFASRRRCGDRLLKIFRRIAFFGSEKPKQKQN